jgi:hypothetical protein
MAEFRGLILQQTLADLILEPEPSRFRETPGTFLASRGLAEEDQEAFLRFQDRFLAYRELARMGLQEPIEDMFPVLKSLLEGAELWQTCVDAFLVDRRISSPHYRDIAPAFLGWLADTRWGSERWPFLAELAHFELLEVLVARFPDARDRAGLKERPEGALAVVLDPATQIVAYTHAVHKATEASPLPEATPTWLLAYRDPEGEAGFMELTNATAAFLVQAQHWSIDATCAALGLEEIEPLWPLLRDLQMRGAVAGYQSPA